MSARRPLAAAAVAVLAVLAAGCSGLGQDSSPSVVPEDALPADLLVQSTTTSTLLAGAAEDATIYLLTAPDEETETLDPCTVDVRQTDEVRAAAEVRLQALIDFDPTETNQCGNFVSNQVPPDLDVLGVTVAENIAVVNLANLGEVQGAGQRRAIAQIVFTLTDPDPALGGVTGVRFLVDGEATAVPISPSRTADAGTVITRALFPELVDASTATTTPAPVPTTAPVVVPPG